jgi:DNA phosphorothioation-dependent restriction protein DptH
MSMSPAVIQSLAEALRVELAAAQDGHCVRVDNLRTDDAVALCESLRSQAAGWSAYVLDGPGSFGIRPERAVELRNRKSGRLCLLVPAGAADAAISSLGNSFAVFDLQGTLKRQRAGLLARLPDDIRDAARLALGVLRGRAQASPEQAADYLGAVVEDPTLETAGAELWRIGLIPDVGADGLEERLPRNAESANKLMRPPRPQSSAEERIGSLGLRPGSVAEDLLVYLARKRLREPSSWLPGLAQADLRGHLTFERWVFAVQSTSDLEVVRVTPFLDRNGVVETWSKLAQPGGPGTQPAAPVGKKRKVAVRWTTEPAKPHNIARWHIELIPSLEEYGEDTSGVDLPSARVAPAKGSASLPLEIDLEEFPVRAVQIRVTPLDEQGAELYGKDGKPLAGVSQQFWLDEKIDVEGGTRLKRDTVSNLAFARLRVALDGGTLAEDVEAGQWSEGDDLRYCVIPLTPRQVARIGISGPMDALEARCLSEPDTGGAYAARLNASDHLRAEALSVNSETNELWHSDQGAAFLRQRRGLFRAIQDHGIRGRIAVVPWSSELTKRARSYANAYGELLSVGGAAALAIDTVHLTIARSRGDESAVLVLPTHPLRLLWYAAYAELFGNWEAAVSAAGKGRTHLLEADLLDKISPLNCPAFAAAPFGGEFVFAQNLRFFWGVLLPAGAPDPARRLSDIAAVLGLGAEDQAPAGIPMRRVADEIATYQATHPYLDALRVCAINPGSGSVLAAGLRPIYERDWAPDAEPPDSLRLDVVVHTHEPLPPSVPVLDQLARELHDTQTRGHSHLSPLVAVAIRSYERVADGSGGAFNLAVVQDLLPARVEAVPDDDREDSSSFYGLLPRLLPSNSTENGRMSWRHRISLPARAPRERHPVVGPLTNDLVDLQRSYLQAVAKGLPGAVDGSVPALVVNIHDRERDLLEAIHRDSDWVLTLDRGMGPEYFESPSAPERHYLLDYAPEFLEGIGYRLMVTTSHRQEVESILARAMGDLGFGMVEESVGIILDHLRTVSGRLALKIVGDDAHAREAVGLGLVAAHLRARGTLNDAILVPVDAHPEIFAPHARRNEDPGTRARCDLLLVRFGRGRMTVSFVEVKARVGTSGEDLLHRMVDQIDATERVFRDLFFRTDPPRLDQALQRSRLAALLRFYLKRAVRSGLIGDPARVAEYEEAIAKLGSGVPELRIDRRGYIVNLAARPRPVVRLRDTDIWLLTAHDIIDAGVSVHQAEAKESDHVGPTAIP